MQQKNLITACIEAYRQYAFQKSYDETFELVRAATDAQKELCFQLRYAVYVEENKFEKPGPRAAERMETDAFDARAVHFLLLHKKLGEVAGALRVILPDDENPLKSFPMQAKCRHPMLRNPGRAQTMFEISRFCSPKKFRKRDRDGKILSSYYDQDDAEGRTFKRRIPYAPAALLRGAFETALNARILEGVWMVDPCHLSSLARIGMEVRALGPHINYLGGAQPVIFNVKNALDTMRDRNPHCWDIISDNGRLQKMADGLVAGDWRDRLLDDDRNESYESAADL